MERVDCYHELLFVTLANELFQLGILSRSEAMQRCGAVSYDFNFFLFEISSN